MFLPCPQDSIAHWALKHLFLVQMTPLVLSQVPNKEKTVCLAHQAAGVKQVIELISASPS